jgi:uncharacterized repeat protein (TIGR03803 family)
MKLYMARCPRCNSGTRRGPKRLQAGRVILEMVLAMAVLGALCAQAQTFTVLYAFKGGADGGEPYAGLLLDNSGNLYGTTYAGGSFNKGTVFTVDTNAKESVLHSFGAKRDGAYPLAALVRDAANNLYGTTVMGGTGGNGTVFRVDTTGKETVLYSFRKGNPAGNVVLDAAGNLYSTTNVGGLYGKGSVFKLDRSGKETDLYSFVGGHFDGEYPTAGLFLDKSGNLYGTTYYGGNYGVGIVFELTRHGGYSVLHNFDNGYLQDDGEYPYAGLIRDAAGNLYGTTIEAYWWPGNSGTVFKLDSQGNETLLYSFQDGSDGGFPYAPVVRDSSGNFYGTTRDGGDNYGVVFEVDSAGQETVLHSFAYSTDGGYPYAGLVRDSAGNLYGTTFQGGSGGGGTVFKLTP